MSFFFSFFSVPPYWNVALPINAITNFSHLGGGIVFDSDEYDEWMETMNKLGANMHCITSAEQLWARRQASAADKSKQ